MCLGLYYSTPYAELVCVLLQMWSDSTACVRVLFCFVCCFVCFAGWVAFATCTTVARAMCCTFRWSLWSWSCAGNLAAGKRLWELTWPAWAWWCPFKDMKHLHNFSESLQCLNLFYSKLGLLEFNAASCVVVYASSFAHWVETDKTHKDLRF